VAATATLTFDPATHTYRLGSRVLPHVTGVIKPLEDYAGVPPSVLEWASERGRMVHEACQFLDEDDLDESSLDPEIAPYVEAYRRFLEEVRPEWYAIEQPVHSDRYGYAGTLDRVGYLTGLKRSPRAVVDLKAVAKLSPVTGLQLAAYAEAWCVGGAAPLIARYALQLRPDKTYRLKRYDEPTDLSTFLSQLSVANWCRRHGKQQGDPTT